MLSSCPCSSVAVSVLFKALQTHGISHSRYPQPRSQLLVAQSFSKFHSIFAPTLSHNIVWTSPSLERAGQRLDVSSHTWSTYSSAALSSAPSPSPINVTVVYIHHLLLNFSLSGCPSSISPLSPLGFGSTVYSSSLRQSLPTNFSNTVVPGVMGTCNTHRVLLLVCLGCSANLWGMFTGRRSLRLVLLLQR